MKNNYIKPETHVFMVKTNATLLSGSVEVISDSSTTMIEEYSEFRSREDFGWEDTGGWNDPLWGKK